MVKTRGGSQTEYEIGKGNKKNVKPPFQSLENYYLCRETEKYTHTHKYMKLKQTK